MAKIKLLPILTAPFCCGMLAGFPDSASSDAKVFSPDAFPIQKGMLAFHSYTDYGSGDGRLFIYDFETNLLQEVSRNWNLQHTLNGHFSPDGSDLVFMAQPKGHSSYSDWNVYIWKVGSEEGPEILTPFYSIPDEDPKYFADGRRVVFKQNGDIKIIELNTKQLSSVTSDGFTVEESMPYPTFDGNKIVYAKNSAIFIIDVNGKNDQALTKKGDFGSYYPIMNDDASFFYVRWASEFNHHDEICLCNILTGLSVVCPFNNLNDDDSDPYPVKNTDYVFFSSNRAGGRGGWDIYLGNHQTGQVWSLNPFGINTSKMELGSAYFTKNASAVTKVDESSIKDPILNPNFPNPFNPSTVISYRLFHSGKVELDVFNSLGQKVRSLIDSYQQAGSYSLTFDTGNLPGGVYILKLKSDGFCRFRKMILLR